MWDKHDYTGSDDHFGGNGKDMQVDKAGKGRTGDEKNGKKKDNLLQIKEEMMKRGRKRQRNKDLTAVPHVAGDELCS